MQRYLILSTILISALAVSACGSKGGSAGSDPGSTPPPGGVALGSRKVPGYTVQAARMSAVAPGAPVTIRVTVLAEAGEPAPAAVEGWVGAEYDESAPAISAIPVAGEVGVYDAVIPLPDPLPADLAAWTRLRFSDGSVLELGRDDFKLDGSL